MAYYIHITLKYTRETKIQSLQYRLVHRTIPCRNQLFQWRLTDNPNCLYCVGNHIDNNIHFFFACERVNNFWKTLLQWRNNFNTIQIAFEGGDIQECLLSGFQSNESEIYVLNYVTLLAKFHIYKYRLFENNDVNLFAIYAN